jgi:hypothetical protein
MRERKNNTEEVVEEVGKGDVGVASLVEESTGIESWVGVSI